MDAKKLAAEKAVEWIKENMVIGLGTGSTAFWAIEKLGEKVKDSFPIRAVATSAQTENLARERNIPIVSFHEIESIDITIDGADEVDRNGNLTKGGGGALLREKIVAYHTSTYLIAVDESKMVEQLGKFPLPVEIVPFAAELTVRKIEEKFGTVKLRQADGKIFTTDNGNWIADIHLFPITDPGKVNGELHSIPGVVETGLFMSKLVSNVIVASKDGRLEVISFNL